MAKIIQSKGKRKTAVARATLKQGSGIIRVNNKLLNTIEPKLVRMKIQEPVILADDVISKVNINVNVFGGGTMAQADASRLAIARSLVKYNKKLEKVFLDYDRQLLVADTRRKETHKPNSHGKARAKRQKSYR
jgi:small subunit ribosomal protein S9